MLNDSTFFLEGIERSRCEQIEFNQNWWRELISDPALAEALYRVETNVHGQILMLPPTVGAHSYCQSQILILLKEKIGGIALAECPISTINGVHAADVGSYSEERFEKVRGQIAFEVAPEICVEVHSPNNTNSEMREKSALYFEAGACEFWLCDLSGKLSFFSKEYPKEPTIFSRLAPEFPKEVDA